MANDGRAPNIDVMDPTVQIRTDLWNTMTLAQLAGQRDLVLDRIGKLQSMPQGDPTVMSLIMALQHGLNDITRLIDSKTVQK